MSEIEIEHAQSIVIKKGFTKLTARADPEDNQVEINSQKLRHHAKRGYEEFGPEKTLFYGSVGEAKHVYELLQEVFADG